MPSKALSDTLAVHWRPRIEAWRNSGEKQKVFCREHDLSYHQFIYWRRKLEPRDSDQTRPTSSALVPVIGGPPAVANGLCLVLPNGMELRGLTMDNLGVVQQLLARL